MIGSRPRRGPQTGAVRARATQAGFTLVEALASVALMSAVLLAIALMAGQWLPSWRAGFAQSQRADQLSLGLERVAADVAAAEYIMPDATSKSPLFDGERSSVAFVRAAIGPASRPQLEWVRIVESADDKGLALVREQAPFTPLTGATRPPTKLGDAVVLVREPFRLSFAYAGPDHKWVETWSGLEKLPSAIRVSVRDSRSGQILAASTAFPVRATAAAPHNAPDADTANAKADAADTAAQDK